MAHGLDAAIAPGPARSHQPRRWSDTPSVQSPLLAAIQAASKLKVTTKNTDSDSGAERKRASGQDEVLGVALLDVVH